MSAPERKLHPAAVAALVVWVVVFVPLLGIAALFRLGVFGI
jgi:hypothetical protein